MYTKITEFVYQNAITRLEYKTHELLCLIGSSGQNTIDYFIFDDKAFSCEYHCKPSPTIINTLQKNNRIYFVGILHSHPPGRHNLSFDDIQYAQSIIRASKNLPFILMGIVSDHQIFLYQVSLENMIQLDLSIVKD